MPLYTYLCPAGHTTDLLRPRTIEFVACACGETASRQTVNRVGVSGFAQAPVGQQDMRHDFRRYSEATAEAEYRHIRTEDQAQRHFDAPPLFTAAKDKAAALAKAGVTADQV